MGARNEKQLDMLLVNPGGNPEVCQSLGNELAAVEPAVWAGLMATFVRKRGFVVEALDANAEDLDPEQTADRIVQCVAKLTAIVVYGYNPSASTQLMPAVRTICEALKAKSGDRKLLLAGRRVATLPERALREEQAEFVCGEVLRFRDHAFQVYFNNPRYLGTIERKFGPETVREIRATASHKLVREFAEQGQGECRNGQGRRGNDAGAAARETMAVYEKVAVEGMGHGR